MSKNPTLDQVSSDVSLGKDGPFLKGDPTFDGGNGAVEIRNSDNSALAEAKGATPTTNESLATKLYVDSAIGVAPTLQSAYENGNTIVTSAVEGDFDVSGTEDVRLSSTQSLVFSGSDDSSVSVTGANLTLRTLTSGDVNVTSAGTTDVQSSGTVTIDSSSGSIGIATDAGGTPVDIATGPDASIVQIANSAAAHAIEIGSTTGAAQTNINGGLGNIAIGSTGAIALDANANSSFTVDSTTGQDLELSTTGVGGGDVIVSSAGTTTGRVQVFSIGNTEIDSAAGITLDANAASTFNVNGGDLTLSTTTSGTLTLNSAGALIGNAFDNPAGAGGNAAFRGGSPTAGNNPGGRMDLNGGTGFGSGAGGFASLGGGISGLLLNAPGGACLVGGGNSVSASGVGGQLTLRGGNTTGTGAGGDIVLTPGTSSGGGADGEVTINGKLNVTGAIDPTALQLDPQAVDPGFTTSIWVDVADNELYYTDAAGMATQVSNVAGGGTLAGVLAAGNTTGGNDIILSSGDVIQSQTAVQIAGVDGVGAGVDGGSVDLTAGNSADGDGGSIVLTAGDSASLNVGDPGGSITLAAGNQTGATGGSAGGSLTFTAGDNSGVGPGGGVSFTTGSTPSGSANDPAGSFVVTTGNNTGTVSASGINGGDVTFSLGSTSAPNSNSRGGAFTVTAGNALANSAFARAGGISLTAGNNTGTTAGSIAGSVTITSGSIPNAAGTAGDITLTPGTDVGGAKGNIVFDYATWPIADGAASTSSSLVTDGAGNLSWVGGASAHQLIETITVSTVGGVASVTFSGLDGDTDYRYYITARFAPGAVDIYEVRPNGSAFAANEGRGTFYEITGVEGSAAAFGNQQTSTNGWILHALLAGGDGGTSFVHGYANMHIQARREVGGLSSGGSNSVRQCFGQGAIIDYNTGAPSYTRNRFTYTSGGWYQATPTNITSLQIIGTSNIAQGSEFSLYRILDV